MTQEELLQLVIDSLPMRAFFKDRDSRYLGANKLFLKDAGLDDLSELVTKFDADLCWPPEQTKAFYRDDQEVIKSEISKINFEEAQKRADGTTGWLKTNKIPLMNKNNECIGVVGTYEEITEQVNYRTKIESESLIDELTQIPNRRYLHEIFEKADNREGGLLFIDLDHFKVINDSLGHSIGDSLLSSVARRLKEQITHNNLVADVARLGGDEFCILLQYPDSKDVQATLAHFTTQLLSKISEPYYLNQNMLTISASIGITEIHGKQQDLPSYFKQADMAMYEAKSKGRNTFCFYDNRMQQHADRRHAIQTNLHHAIAKNELFLVYQPQYNHQDNVTGIEALVRWNNDELGFVPPDEFIKIAEETGIIQTLGKWIINQALADFKTMLSLVSLPPTFKLAINISKEQFSKPTFVDEISKALLAHNIDGERIQLEVTESLFIEHGDIASSIMQQCKLLGMSLALDDFGTGYSSLSYLVNLPIDKLKLDRSFVTNIDANPRNRKLVASIIDMAQSLDMDYIAEGIETAAERDELISIHCLEFQGYLFSKPLNFDDFMSLMNK